MIDPADVAVLEEKTYKFLWDYGIGVPNDELTELCLARGCRRGRDHRIRVPRELIQEMVGFQKQSQEAYEDFHRLVYTCGPDWAHHLLWTGQTEEFRTRCRNEFLMQAFDCGPTTYYDYQQSAVMPVDGQIFQSMLRFAEATPEIGYTSCWYRQDLPPRIERLQSLVEGLKITKKLDGIEAIQPEMIKYLKEASVIVYGDAGSSAFLAGSECMTMPAILEARSAQDILERKRCGIHRYHIASMPTLGISTPVTLAGAIVLAAAELIGGMVVCWCADPQSDLSARMITLVADMRNGNSTTFGPAYIQYNNAVRQLFVERWGGHCMVEVFFSPTARRPGLQAVAENFYATSCLQRWENDPDIPYAGMGALHEGGLGSPTQFMLDMQIRKAQWMYNSEIPVNEETIAWEQIVSAVEEGGGFLDSDHTFRHFRELYIPELFRSDDPSSGPWDGSEAAILDTCEQMWLENLSRWEPPQWPAETTRALDELLKRAGEELRDA
ncbi:MAG: trimethylamine methyltransferase family protein [Spirochaetales bacterium]|nr:trimethylamine methyltransferase family protein [Spirochaetales bacterium]